jgi:hypothetical protein
MTRRTVGSPTVLIFVAHSLVEQILPLFFHQKNFFRAVNFG